MNLVPHFASQPPLVLPDDTSNRALVAEVHPPDWANPAPGGRYNLVVVGAGTAGLVSAAGAAGLGARVALVEKHLMGGDCLNTGCVPSKALLAAARVAHTVRSASRFGVRGMEDARVDFAAVMDRMRRLRAGIAPHDAVKRFAGLGVDVYLGEARFVSPTAIEVDGRRLTFARAVIATGARPARLPVPGLDEAGYLTNETVFSLVALPRRLLVVGAGPIGCELAQAFRRFGSDVTVISAGRLLPREETQAGAVLARRFAAEGIQMRLGARLSRVERSPEGKRVVFTRQKTGEDTVIADEILLAVGRAANVDGLGLDRAGVTSDGRGVEVDDRLRTRNPRVYAAGDDCSRYQFTHAADAMARLVIQNALFFGRKRASALHIPWCTYTDPEVAHVGVNEHEARERGVDVITHEIGWPDVDRAVLEDETEGFARVAAERRSGRLLGATVVGSHAGEIISEVTLALQAGLGLGALSRTIHPYPTRAEILKRAGDAHLRARLGPKVKRVLERMFAWTR